MQEILCNNENVTKMFASNLASVLKKGDVIVLSGELGSGKTKFTEGVLNYFDLQDEISSPTFTIVQEYEDGRVPFYHFDVYRISDPCEMYEIGFDEYINGEGICLIEWASLIEDVLPEDVIKVNISKDLDKGIDYRVITVEGME